MTNLIDLIQNQNYLLNQEEVKYLESINYPEFWRDISTTGIFFYSVKEAARAFNLNPTTLTMYLRGKCKNRTSLVYA